jgi:uncharacterized DUF497 family protein
MSLTAYKLGRLEVEWDDAKAASNEVKHGVSFVEATTAFVDKYAERMPDPKHSEDEERFLLLAASVGNRILVVVHTVRVRLRIISARLAKSKERRRYEDARDGRR